MLDSSSRYANVVRMTLATNKGLTIQYLPRRFIPRGEQIPSIQQVRVIAGDRIDLLTSRTIGDPQQFWRICDANNAMYPLELSRKPGRLLSIPMLRG